ncbi:MAG TPA: Fic family protein [Terriglobia bacterium]|nr:Fic family protein [Terriglobia bacterium]
MTQNRSYEKSHPWITFRVDLRKAPPDFWIMLGECHSKCEHLAGVPLSPEINKNLHQVYLAKGVAATTAIEGNTLSEKQVLEHIEGTLDLAPSQDYLKKEIENIIEGCNLMLEEIGTGKQPPVNAERIKQLNRIVLDGLKLADQETIPGEVRSHSVGAGRYRGAPAKDCEYLLEKLAEWLNGPDFVGKPGTEAMFAILKAILAHVYIAWIHPFGDGNGRTARLLEVQILLSSGVPSPAAQLLSNHYNKTRRKYYEQLDVARTDLIAFLSYAIEGFRDELREQITAVKGQQLEIAWINHVHKMFQGLKGFPHDRRKRLALALSSSAEPVPFDKLTEMSARVALDYKDRTYRTLLRDVKALQKMDLIKRNEEGRWEAKRETILAFLPVRASKELS